MRGRAGLGGREKACWGFAFYLFADRRVSEQADGDGEVVSMSAQLSRVSLSAISRSLIRHHRILDTKPRSSRKLSTARSRTRSSRPIYSVAPFSKPATH